MVLRKALPGVTPVVFRVQSHGVVNCAVLQQLDHDLVRPQLLYIVLPDLDDPPVVFIIGRNGRIFRSRVLGRGRNIIEPRIVFQIWERDQEWLGCVGVSIRHESAANDQIEAWHKALLPVWERKHPLRVRFSAVQQA